MTIPSSTRKNIDVTISSARRFRKKAFCVYWKIILIIHPELVERLGINEDTWIDEEEADNGISLTICNSSEQGNPVTEARSNEGNHKES
jgi:hypothetical protein